MAQFATEGYILLLALEIMARNSPKEVPCDFPYQGSNTDRLRWLGNLVWQVVEFCWVAPDVLDMYGAARAFRKSMGNRSDSNDPNLAFCVYGKGTIVMIIKKEQIVA